MPYSTDCMCEINGIVFHEMGSGAIIAYVAISHAPECVDMLGTIRMVERIYPNRVDYIATFYDGTDEWDTCYMKRDGNWVVFDPPLHDPPSITHYAATNDMTP